MSHAAEIEGTVVVTRRLTRPRVTEVMNNYQRGARVELLPDENPDALAFERSHVVIYLEGRRPVEPRLVSMEQKNRQFVPDMLVIPAGSTVSFPNLDPIFHNVFSLSRAKEFDLGNYPKDHTRTVTFPRPGVVFVDCHLHSNMAAVIVVSPNQWSTRADASGRFKLDDVPAGEYTIVAWHKSAGFLRRQVILTVEHNAVVNFTVPLGRKMDDGAMARR